jgi:hypothetical protein
MGCDFLEYDVALKLLLQGSARLTVSRDGEIRADRQLVEKADLLGETADGSLVHVELQSGNEAAMALRMAEYCLGVLRLYGKFPRHGASLAANVSKCTKGAAPAGQPVRV